MSDEIKKLTPYQHVRLRTTVYYGSTSIHTQPVLQINDKEVKIVESSWVPAVFTSVREIIDNSIDELVVKGFGNKLDIKYDTKTLEFEVSDNGRGIPIDWDENHQMHKATLALSELMTGRNFDSRDNTAGMNGIGASGVNFCSEYFNVEIHRDNKKFNQKFSEGNDLFDELNIGRPIIKDVVSTTTGTRISFKLSNKVFDKIVLPIEFVRSRVFEIAYNNPQIHVTFNGKSISSKGGVIKNLFSKNNCMTISIDKPEFTSTFYLVTDLIAEGEYNHSVVNNIPVFQGGSHIDSFKKLFATGLLNALEKESKRRKLYPNRSDIYEGFVIYNTTRMLKPEFDSQSKTRLINDNVDGFIKSVLDDEETFKKLIKNNKEWIEQIYERCATRTQRKDEAEIAKLGRKMLRTKIPRLLDANGKDRSKCVIFICEGNSAATTLSAVRDPEIHGALPLRGKIMNVRGESTKDIISNEIISDIMASVGLSIGQPAIRSNLRYGKIYLAADQDQDGANITALLVNFFYLHWPELFDPNKEPIIHCFMTPFIIQEKGKSRHYWYAHDYHEYNPSDWKNCPKATRAKGLGSLEEIDWKNSLANPQLIPLLDDGKLDETLDLIFNEKKADLRKMWISL